MRKISRFASKAKQALACVVLMAPMSVVWAQGEPIDDEDLANVWGQAMFTVDNSGVATGALGASLDLTRITLNADVKLNANLSNVLLGKVGAGPADLDIANLNFVGKSTYAGSTTNPYVTLIDPYIEFVYKNQDNAATREIIGLRLGFGQIEGDLGLKLNGLKGNIKLEQDASITALADKLGPLTLNSATRLTDFTSVPQTIVTPVTDPVTGQPVLDPVTGLPQTTTTVTPGGAIPVGRVGAVRASGATDFFISLLSEATVFKDKEGADIVDKNAPEGVSLNWTKGVSYLNAQGTILPNPLPPLRTRQGG